MCQEIQVVRSRFLEYSDIFNQLDPSLIPPFFHLPSMLMTPNIVAKPMTTQQDVLDVFTPFMGALKQQNFTRSQLDLDKLSEKMLSDNIAIVSGSATRFKQDEGTGAEVELERIGITYTFRRDSKDKIWKIITGIIHLPETAIAFANNE